MRLYAIILAGCHKDHCQRPLSAYCDGLCPTFSDDRDAVAADITTPGLGNEAVIFQCKEPFLGIFRIEGFSATLSYFDDATEEYVGGFFSSDTHFTCSDPFFRSLVLQYGHPPECVEDCTLEAFCDEEGCLKELPACPE